MSDYRLDEHRVDGVDVLESWVVAAVLVAALIVVVLPIAF